MLEYTDEIHDNLLTFLKTEQKILIIQIDKSLKVLDIQGDLEPVLGYKVTDIKNKNILDFINDTEIEVFENLINGFENTNNTQSLEINFISVYGKPVNFNLSISLSKDKKMFFCFAFNNEQTAGLRKKLQQKEKQISNLNNKRMLEMASADEVIETLIKNLENHLKDAKNANTKLEEQNKQIQEELTLASELQMSLLPRNIPEDLPIEFVSRYLPYTYIGGDFFDFIRLKDNRVCIMIADAAGHGITSALIISMFKISFEYYAMQLTDIEKIVTNVNREFCKSITHSDSYITGFFIVIDLETLKIQYLSAGHPSMVLFRKTKEVENLNTDGFFIGMFENTKYEVKETILNPGDSIMLFTDGIIEVQDEKELPYGKQRLLDLIMENWDYSINEKINKILDDLILYSNRPTFDDDITIVWFETIESL